MFKNRKPLNSNLTHIVSDDNFAHQIPFPSLNLSSRYFNMGRALSPDHANESAGFCSEAPLPAPCGSDSFYIMGADLFQSLDLFWYSEYYNYECIGLEDYTLKCLPLKCNTCTYYKMAYMPYFYSKPMLRAQDLGPGRRGSTVSISTIQS